MTGRCLFTLGAKFSFLGGAQGFARTVVKLGNSLFAHIWLYSLGNLQIVILLGIAPILHLLLPISRIWPLSCSCWYQEFCHYLALADNMDLALASSGCLAIILLLLRICTQMASANTVTWGEGISYGARDHPSAWVTCCPVFGLCGEPARVQSCYAGQHLKFPSAAADERQQF